MKNPKRFWIRLGAFVLVCEFIILFMFSSHSFICL